MPDSLGTTADLEFTVHHLAPGALSADEMKAWKTLVRRAVDTNAQLTLRYYGGGNQITSYRLFFMLQYAKDVRVRRLVFECDLKCWPEGALEWLSESPADEMVLA